MGILNVTPDSFSDGGKFNQVDAALKRIEEMIEEGAAIIDIGGESTRPGAEPVSVHEEMERVIPILEKAIPKYTGTFFSIDTTKYEVARQALEAGAHFINDVSGLQEEPRFVDLCKAFEAGLIIMHSQGTPETMQDDPSYNEVVSDIRDFFKKQLKKCRGLDNIILDPGIGFGKTQQHNIEIIKNLDKFHNLGYPLMVGASRKSMIGRLLNNRDVDDRIIGSVVVHYHAMAKGAKIIRVHDVKEANDSILVYNALIGN
ncbi:MAG: dihydropteroate synthase [Balneolaceae bacterium]|nr:dihydropteroate synthase [Balneolaceae bacterium]